MSDPRIYTVKAIQQFIDNQPQGQEFVIDLYCLEKEKGKRLQGTVIDPGYIYDTIMDTQYANDCQINRIRIYKKSDLDHAIATFSKELLYKLVTNQPEYDRNAPRKTYNLGEIETRSSRLQILMRPSIKRELSRVSKLHNISMSTIIDELVGRWLVKQQSKEQ